MSTPESLALLQQMLSREPSDREAVALALETHDDPRVRLIAQYMKQPSVARHAGEDGADEDAHVAIAEEAPKVAHIERARRVRRRLRRLRSELETAQTIGDTLAVALGACYLCWGEDERCERCNGAGSPGWARPNAELYGQFIAPAMRRLKREYGVVRSTDPSPTGGQTPVLAEEGTT